MYCAAIVGGEEEEMGRVAAAAMGESLSPTFFVGVLNETVITL